MDLDNSFIQQDLIYLLEPPCDDIKIQISDFKTRGHGITSYIGYIIIVSQPVEIQVERRYRQFVAVRQRLVLNWPGCFIPVLPRKHMTSNNSLPVANQRKKYLNYFLNCIAKSKYLYNSKQFQVFLTTKDYDVRKTIQNLPKIGYQQILDNYRSQILELQIMNASQLQFRQKQQIPQFQRSVKEGKIPLTNIKKQVRKLALAKEDCQIKTRVLYNQALPKFQIYSKGQGILSESPESIFHKQVINKAIQQSINEQALNYYWVIYESLRVEIYEQQAAYEAITRMNEVKKDYDRTIKKIQTNNMEINDIRNKNFTLKQLFSPNVQTLLNSLIEENQYLEKQKVALLQLCSFCSTMILLKVIPEYRKKRERIWSSIWQKTIDSQINQASNIQKLLQIIKDQFGY